MAQEMGKLRSQIGNDHFRGRSARGLYLASILRAPAKLEILARYSISFLEILAKPKVGVRQAQYLIFL
jgi:hypothetical protein